MFACPLERFVNVATKHAPTVASKVAFSNVDACCNACLACCRVGVFTGQCEPGAVGSAQGKQSSFCSHLAGAWIFDLAVHATFERPPGVQVRTLRSDTQCPSNESWVALRSDAAVGEFTLPGCSYLVQHSAGGWYSAEPATIDAGKWENELEMAR